MLLERKSIVLSLRLQALRDHLLENEQVWDLCCDHGLMGLSAYQLRKFPRIHFVDQAEHLIDRLTDRFFKSYEDPANSTEVYFYKKPAEHLVVPIEGSVVIAGIGGRQIVSILKVLSLQNQLMAKRLILSPHRDISAFPALIQEDRCLSAFYELVKIVEVLERGRIRKIFVYDRV